jgi:hypothetical protein
MRTAISIAPILMGFAGAAAADVANIQPQKDNTLYESPAGSLSNGSGPGMFCGRSGTGLTRRALVRFDVAGAIPPGSTVNSATLSLNVSMSLIGEVPVSLHRVLADWGEGASVSMVSGGGQGAPAEPGDATWVHTYYNTQVWATVGGDFTPTPSATHPVAGTGPYTWGSTAGMVADVQAWLDAPAANYGWLIGGDESAPATARRFDTREHLVAAQRPVLTVDFTPPCYPDCTQSGGLTVADFGCFQTKFVQGDPYADCDGVNGLTVQDFGCFQTKFVQGCP